YIAWLQQRDAAAAMRYWRERVALLDEPTLLGNAFAIGQRDAAGYGELRSEGSDSETRERRRFAPRGRATLNTLSQGAWAVLLQRHLGQRTVAFGATVAGRPTEVAGAEGLVGLFINTVPVVATPGATEGVGTWLRRLQAQSLEARAYEHAPLNDIQ